MIENGQKAPEFTLVDTEKKPRQLTEFLGRKTVLAFYPAAFTGVCTKEMCTFQDSLAELQGIDANVVAISVDGPFTNAEFARKNNLRFPVLSDINLETVRSYGVELHNFAGVQGYNVAQRSIFVLDADGVIRYGWMAENPGIEPEYDVIRSEISKI